MSEFLKNFRSAQSNRYSGRRNPYDGHYYSQGLRSGNERKPGQSGNSNSKNTNADKDKTDIVSKIDEILPTVKALLESFADQQDELFELKQRNSANMDIIASAFNEIAIALGGTGDPMTENHDKPTTAPEKAAGTQYSLAELEKEGMDSAAGHKREIIRLMKKLRKKGGTYKEIAAFLNEKGIPTFSNNGRWHAQTIHRLCSK